MRALPIKIVIPSNNKLFLAKNSLQDYGPIFKRNVNPKRKQSQLQQKQSIGAIALGGSRLKKNNIGIQLTFSSLLIASALSTLESPANVIVKLVRDKH